VTPTIIGAALAVELVLEPELLDVLATQPDSKKDSKTAPEKTKLIFPMAFSLKLKNYYLFFTKRRLDDKK
jgi:hypothetical protein